MFNILITEQIPIFHSENLTLDPQRRQVYVNQKKVLLCCREFNVLYLLLKHPGRVFSKKQIYENVWNEIPVEIDNAVMCLIYSLRKKLEKSTGYCYIQTVRGVGYKFEVTPTK